MDKIKYTHKNVFPILLYGLIESKGNFLKQHIRKSKLKNNQKIPSVPKSNNTKYTKT